MYEKFTDDLRKILLLANQEAFRFNHDYVGTEHLLLGIVKARSNPASSILESLNIELSRVRLEVEKLVQSGPDMVSFGKYPQTPRAKKVIEYAMSYARTIGTDYVGPLHLLYGLVNEEEGIGAKVLTGFVEKITLMEAIRNRIKGEERGIESTLFWKIPKKDMDLAQVLGLFGYIAVDSEGQRHYYSPELNTGERKDALLRLDNAQTPTILYDTKQLKQMLAAYKLRSTLEFQGVIFSEEPDRATVAGSLRESVKDKTDLADKILGK